MNLDQTAVGTAAPSDHRSSSDLRAKPIVLTSPTSGLTQGTGAEH